MAIRRGLEDQLSVVRVRTETFEPKRVAIDGSRGAQI